MLTALLLLPTLFASTPGRHEQADRAERHHGDHRVDSRVERAQAQRRAAAAHHRHHAAKAAAHRHHAYKHHAHGPHRHAPPVVVRRAPPPPPRAVVHSTARKDPTHDLTLSVSALHLAVPMAAVNAEFELTQRSGLQLTGGLGAYQSAALVDVGAELRGYALGNFDRGVFVGGSGRFTNVPFYSPTDPAFTAAAVVGAKYTFDVPLTLEASVGPQLALTEHHAALGPLVKLNLGFSF